MCPGPRCKQLRGTQADRGAATPFLPHPVTVIWGTLTHTHTLTLSGRTFGASPAQRKWVGYVARRPWNPLPYLPQLLWAGWGPGLGCLPRLSSSLGGAGPGPRANLSSAPSPVSGRQFGVPTPLHQPRDQRPAPGLPQNKHPAAWLRGPVGGGGAGCTHPKARAPGGGPQVCRVGSKSGRGRDLGCSHGGPGVGEEGSQSQRGPQEGPAAPGWGWRGGSSLGVPTASPHTTAVRAPL